MRLALTVSRSGVKEEVEEKKNNKDCLKFSYKLYI